MLWPLLPKYFLFSLSSVYFTGYFTPRNVCPRDLKFSMGIQLTKYDIWGKTMGGNFLEMSKQIYLTNFITFYIKTLWFYIFLTFVEIQFIEVDYVFKLLFSQDQGMAKLTFSTIFRLVRLILVDWLCAINQPSGLLTSQPVTWSA
jgi:hypothetical protein